MLTPRRARPGLRLAAAKRSWLAVPAARPSAGAQPRIVKRARTGLLVGFLTLALVPSTASGAVTFGSDLGDPVTGSLLFDFTLALRQLDAGDRSPGGVTAPSDGVITGWRVKKGESAITLALRVVDGNRSVFQSQPTPFPSSAGVYRFDTRARVKAGDAIGVDQISGVGAPIAGTGGSHDYWFPLLDPTEDRAPSGSSNSQLLLNADLEPDCDDDGFGDETQDQSTESCEPPPADTDPPETTITKGAPNKTDKTKVKYRFSSDEPDSTFECSLKGKGLKKSVKQFGDCDPPRKYKGLDEGKFKFKARAIDAAGNVDTSPAKDKFKVVD